MKKLSILVLMLVLLTACNPSENESNKNDKVIFLKSIALKVPEPSGLAFDNGFLWTVSDENKTVYKIDTLGNIISSFTVNGEDLEGVTVVSDSSLAVILERTREVVLITKNGKELNRYSVNLTGELNLGLEGISYNPANTHFYILNEKNNRLILELDKDLNELNRKELTFSNDLSGICYDSNRDAFWIVSDESQSVSNCNYKFEVVDDFKVNIPQMEGVAFDPNSNRLFIVSDRAESLYIYQLK